jgi:hypothetical protein
MAHVLPQGGGIIPTGKFLVFLLHNLKKKKKKL